jgi:drug/metabolite transporter (DMT)-like permease
MYLSPVGTRPLVNAYCVASLTDFLSAMCLVPFASLKGMPRHSGPWLAALCLIPSAMLIVASRVLGQCLVQLMLKFSVLFGALAVDMFMEGRRPSRERVAGMFVVLSGVVLVGSSGKPAAESPDIGSAVLGVTAALASGMGYVLSARFCMPKYGADASSTAFVSFLASSLLQAPCLLISQLDGTGFRLHADDLPLWIFVVAQGVFYTRSFQILPTQISYAATFTLSLTSQLITAALFDQRAGFLGQITGLGLVFFGAVISELSST